MANRRRGSLPWAAASRACAIGALLAAAAGPQRGARAGEEGLGKGQYWLLDFRCVAVRPAIVGTSRAPEGDVFWYLVYTLRNRDGEDHTFRIDMKASSDKGRTYACMALPEVEGAAERKEGRALQGPVDLREALKARASGDDAKYEAFTKIKAGETRWCVATFNRIDPEADRIEVLVRGLTNELRVTVLDDGRRRITQRALKLVLERPGDEFAHGLDRFRVVRREWTTYSVDIPATGS